MSYTREDLEDMKMSELRELTTEKSVKRDDLIRAILRTPDVDLPDKPKDPEAPVAKVAYDASGIPERWAPKKEWLDQLANQYAIERFEWVEPFRAYRVYIGGRHADWITWEQIHKLFGKPVPPVRRSRMPQRPSAKQRVIKYID